MIKVKIVLNEEKIKSEGTFDLAKMKFEIDKLFFDRNFHKEDDVFYVGTDHEDDFANAGLVCVGLGRSDWFLDNVLEWKWHRDGNEEDLLKDTGRYKAGFRS